MKILNFLYRLLIKENKENVAAYSSIAYVQFYYQIKY